MNSISRENKNLFKKDTPLYITIFLVLISGIVVYNLFPHPEEGKSVTVVSQAPDCIPEMTVVRSKDYQLAHRVLLAETKNENPALASFKDRINQFISQSKSSGGVNDISVYYRNMNSGAWFSINDGTTYNPASLMKVSYMIAILRQAENNPGLLSKQIYFDKHISEGNNQNIKDFALKENKYYSIRELLQYMIINSDNDAATLISQAVSMDVYNKLFSDLDLPAPTQNAEYYVTVSDYCKFFRVLFNSSYVRDDYSEFALETLTKSTYRDGLLKNLTQAFPVAHKFGERVINRIQQLHEVGIFYAENHPYLLGVMSSGTDLRQLSNVLAKISEITYQENNRSN